MATFEFKSLFGYSSGGNLVTQSDQDGTLTDGDTDTTFETGSPADQVTFTVVGFAPDTIAEYVGQATFDGEVVPVFLGTSGFFSGQYLVASAREFTDVSAPAAIVVPPADTTPFNTVCFTKGTSIACPDKSRAVETLQIGDQILTAAGQVVPVKWIGRQTLRKWQRGVHVQPVRIQAGALGSCLPQTDLTVTADHGMVIDGLVINASALVNANTIDCVPMDELEDQFTVYHIETEGHEVILANGAPTETFIDAAGRANFDNFSEYMELYGVERIFPEMNRPRISSRRLLPSGIKARLGIADDANQNSVSISA